jgi:alpha-tubulin suppressor-like RCC1 family protein
VTSSCNQLNYVDNVISGIGSANKALIPDSNRNISNINSLSCDSLTVNGNVISLQESEVPAESNSPYLQKLTPGKIYNNKAIILDTSSNVETINKLSVNELKFNNSIITDSNSKYRLKKNNPITFTVNSTTYSNNLSSICWSNELGIGVIVASTGSGNRVMTSTNGINWIERSCPDMNWTSVCWSPELSLFIAVANGGNDNDMRMISSDGINWSQPINNIIPTEISNSQEFAFLLNNNGTVQSVGDNTSGQLGTGNNINNTIFTNISITNVQKIATGSNHTLFLLNNGTIKSVGANSFGQLGDGTSTNSNTYVNVLNITNAIDIQCGNACSMALLADGTIRTWGNNANGTIGNGTTGSTAISTPVTVPNITNAIAIAMQYRTAFALLSDGTLRGWGSNSFREIGDGTIIPKTSPVVSLSGINTITKISAGELFNLALLSNGTVMAWGSNSSGQVGNGTTSSSSNPILVPNLSNVVDIATGKAHSIVLLSNGTVMTWGMNTNGQLGIGSITNTHIPTLVTNLTNINKIFARYNTTYVILSNNTIKCWGANLTQILGNNNSTQQTLPIDIWSIKSQESFWSSITWVSDLNLFIAVANSGNVKIMISSDGINWNPIYGISVNLNSIAWSKPLQLLTAVGTGTNPILTSPNGINWTNRTSTSNTWNSVIWSDTNYMFIAVASSGSGNRIITSSNGTSWATRTSPEENNWVNICHANELGLNIAVASSGTNRIMYSDNGTEWYVVNNSSLVSNLDNIIWVSSLQKFILISGANESQNSNILNSNIFNEIVEYKNIGKVNNSFSNTNTYNLNPAKIIAFSYNFTPNASIWVNELNTYVIGGTTGAVALSTDGYQWIKYSTNISNTITSIAWSPQLQILVAVCSSTTNNVITSTDGINWIIRNNVPTGFGNTWNSVTWSPSLNLFVAVGNATHLTNRIMTSTDGINWTIRNGFDNNWNSICWSPELSLFVVVGVTNNRRMYSYNGVNWFLHNTNTGSANSENFKSVCWSPELNLFAAISADRVVVSKNGINWNYRTITSNSWTSICWAPGFSIFIAVSTGANTSARIAISSDGLNWRYINTTTDNSGWNTITWSANLNNFAAFNNNNVLTFNNILYQNISLQNNNNMNYMLTHNYYKDNIIYNNWNNYNSNVNNEWSSICYSTDLNLIVAVSKSGNNRVMTSSNGINWTSQIVPLNRWESICWASDLDLFVAVASSGSDNRVMTSPNGINWTARVASIDNEWTSVCWSTNLSLFVAVASSGSNNRIMTSSNGITWTTRISPVNNNWTSVCWSTELSLFVAVASSGSNNRVMTSPNGITWTVRTTPIDNNWISVCWSSYFNRFIAIANTGNGNRIMKSLNGITWDLSNINYKPNINITTSFKSIYAGNLRSCAIMNNNVFRYWGNDSSYHFGSGTASQTLPTISNDIHSSNGFWRNIQSMATTNTTSIVLLKNGTIQTRGSGQLGIDTPNNGNSFRGVVNIPNLNNVIEITAGNNFVLALLNNGTIKSWGNNSNGQLGNNSTINSLIPINVSNINNITKIASHESALHSLALLNNGTVMAWGINSNGQLGINNTTQQLIPTLINNLNNVISIAVGGNHSLALLSNGTIMAWGLNTSGQLGNGNNTQQNVPTQVLNINNAIAISAGNDFSLALLSNGTVMAWGNNTNGQLGDSTNISKSTPVLISNLNNVNIITAGSSHSLALLNNGTIMAWGMNNNGQLGNNSTTNSNIPINVLLISNVPLRDVKINTINDISYINNNWSSIIYSDDSKSFVGISSSGTNRIIMSNDGINWFSKPLQITNNWSCICWHNLLGQFIGLSSNENNNVVISDIITQSLLSTLTTTGTEQIGLSNQLLVIGGSSAITGLTIYPDSNNKLLRLTRNNSDINNVDFTTNNVTSLSDVNLNIINNSNNKIINFVTHNNTTGLKFNNILLPVSANDLNKLNVSNGISEPSKALIVDTNLNISGINNITVNSLAVNNKIMVNINDNNNNYIADITAGIAAPSKAVTSNNLNQISNLNNVNSTLVTFNNKQQLESSLNKSRFDISTSYFNNMMTNSNNPTNILSKTICWSPELSIFVAGGITWHELSITNKFTSINYSYDGIKWYSTLTQVTNNNSYVSSIAWSPTLSLFVATYWNSYIIGYSSNGINWNYITLSSSSFSTNWTSVQWGNNLFVAISNNGSSTTQIATSPNGITWTPRTSPNANAWTSLVWGNNIFVAVSTTNSTTTIMTSTNGTSWSARNCPSGQAGNQWRSVTWGNNLFIAVSSTGTNRLMRSSDGITWTAGTTLASESWTSVIWASQLSLFIASNNSNNTNNRIATSPDGINWTLQNTTNVNIHYSCLCNSPQLNLIIGGSDLTTYNGYYFNRMVASNNALSWNLIDTSYDLVWTDLIYIEQFNKYFAISDAGHLSNGMLSKQLATSSNGIDWNYSFIDPNINPRFKQLAWSPELNTLIALLVLPDTVFYKTIDGINWTSISVPSGTWNYIKWIPQINIFIAVASAGSNRAIYSTDGTNWSNLSLPNSNNYTSIDYSSSLNLIMITYSSIPTGYYTSSDGINWVNRTIINSLTSPTNSKVVWISQLNLFIYSTANSSAYYISTNGINWTSSEYTISYGTKISRANVINTSIPIWINKFNKLYIIARVDDNKSRIMESSDGITWTSIYSMPSIHNAYSNLYWSNSKNQLIAYGYGTFQFSYSPFLILNHYIDPIKNYNLSSINTLNNYNTKASTESVSTWRSTSLSTNWIVSCVCYSPELNLFVALATGKIFTSSNGGVTWMEQTYQSNPQNNWNNVIWAAELKSFVAVGGDVSGYVMRSSNGSQWSYETPTNIATNNTRWSSICWSPKLFLLVAVTADGIHASSYITPNMTSNISMGKVASASSILNSTSDAWYAFNSSTTDGWYSNDFTYNSSTGIYVGGITTLDLNNNSYAGEWLQIEYQTATQISNVKITPKLESQTTRGPRNYVLLGSNDGSSWVLLNSYTNITYPATSHSNIITTSPYFYFRLVIQRVGNLDSGMTNSGSVQIASLTLEVPQVDGTLNRVMISDRAIASDVIHWSSQTAAAANSWSSVCWSEELCLFVAVASSGIGNRIMTSPDGMNWTSRVNPVDNDWKSVCWSAELCLFVAVASSGTGNRIMTSPNGINWTSRVNPVDNDWESVCWAPKINQFIAVAFNIGNNTIMTSIDGINWIIRTINSDDNGMWKSVCWSSDYNVAIVGGTNGRLLSSTLSLPYPRSFIRSPTDLFINQNNGNVGLGMTNPTFQLQLSTDLAAKPSSYVWSISSDQRLKENIEDADLNICYNNIKNLRLVKYTWNENLYDINNLPDIDKRTQLGWIADEVEEIFPKSISLANLHNYNDCKTLDSDQLIVSLYGTLQKLLIEYENQNEEINNINNEITILQNYINQLDISFE